MHLGLQPNKKTVFGDQGPLDDRIERLGIFDISFS